MSFNTAALTAYIDDDKFALMMQTQVKSRTAEIVEIVGGLKGSSHLQFLNTDVVFQADGCSFTANGSTTLTQRKITVGEIKLQEELCAKELDGFWTQKMMQIGADGDNNIPAEIEGAWLDQKLAKIKYELEKADWQGDTLGAGNLAFYDGLIKIIDAGTPINGNPTGITIAVGITETNVVSILQGMYKLVPENIIGADDLTLFVGEDVFRLYQLALINANLYNYVANEDVMTTKLFGTNVTIQGVGGLTSTDRLFAGKASNFVIGLDGDADEDNLKVWFSEDDRVTKLHVSFKRGTQVYFDTEVVEFTLLP